MNPSRRQFLRTCGLVGAGVAGASLLPACMQTPKPTVNDVARTLIDQMGVEEKLAQLIIATPEQLSGTSMVLHADEALLGGLQTMPVCGVIFFGGNLESTEQTRNMLLGIATTAQENTLVPPLLCIDEEGGTIQRIGGNPGFDAPSIANASEIGATQDVAVAQEAAHSIASVLADLGFNVDFAPSCDIASTPQSWMRLRSFGAEAELVAKMVEAEVTAFNEEGILCCAKHFPGIGDPQDDSHQGSIYSDKTLEELEVQLLPFAAAIDAGVPLVMMGHLSAPQVTGTALPASISPVMVQEILRGKLGYEGVIVTDSLSMGALREFCSPRDAALAAIEAGCDIALMPPELDEAYAGLLDAVSSERLPLERVDQSLERILALKLRAFPDRFGEEVQEQLAQCAPS